MKYEQKHQTIFLQSFKHLYNANAIKLPLKPLFLVCKTNAYEKLIGNKFSHAKALHCKRHGAAEVNRLLQDFSGVYCLCEKSMTYRIK